MFQYAYDHIYQPSARAGYDTKSIFKRSLTGLNSEPRLVASLRAEEPSLPYYLPIAGGRIFGFVPFPRYVKCYVKCNVKCNLSGPVSFPCYVKCNLSGPVCI